MNAVNNTNTQNEQPMVSIGMATYNHEKYIAKAIESVLMQEVNFSYELVIGEDCSTDHTRDIVIEYQKKYPDVIRLILHDENVGMQKNSDCLRRACKGKYRANLEGDDYWLPIDKLQTQVDFLENNPDFIAIGGDFLCINDYGKPCSFPWGDITHTYCQDDEYTKEHLAKWLLPSHISATIFRNIFRDYSEEELKQFESIQILGDRRVYMLLVMLGRIYHEKRPVMVRRVLTKSNTSFTSAIKKSNWQEINYDWLCEAERFAKERFHYHLDLSARKEMHWCGSIKMFFWNPTKTNYNVMMSILKKSPNKIKYIYIAVAMFVRKVISVLKRDGIICGLKRGTRKVKNCVSSYWKQKNNSSRSGEFTSIATSFSKK